MAQVDVITELERRLQLRVTPIVLLFVAALALRIMQVGVLPTGDENITYEMVRRFGPLEMLTEIPRVQPHFPLYYIFLDVWGMVFPLESARYVSTLAGATTPVVVFVWARNHLPEWRAFLAGLLVTISPLLAIQSRWVRMYALLTLAVVLSWWCAWRYLHENSRGVTYGLSALVVVGLHPFGIAVVVAQLLWLSIEQYQTTWKPWFRGIVGILSLCASVPAVYLLARVAGVQGTGTIEPQHMHIQYASRPVLRAVVLPLTTVIGTLYHWLFVALAVALVAVYGYWSTQERLWHSKRGRMLLCWILASLAVLYVGHAIRPILMLKYIGWLGPAVALLVAAVTPPSNRGSLAIGAIVGMAATNLLLGWLIKLNNSMVAIWESGVLEAGAI